MVKRRLNPSVRYQVRRIYQLGYTRIVRKHLYFGLQFLGDGRIRIGRLREGTGINGLSDMELHRMEPKIAAARPGFECSTDSDGDNRNPQLVCHDGRALLEFRDMAINGACPLGKN